MLDAITTALTSVLSWFGTVVTSITSSTGALYPLLPIFAVGIAIAITYAVIRLVRSVAWGA